MYQTKVYFLLDSSVSPGRFTTSGGWGGVIVLANNSTDGGEGGGGVVVGGVFCREGTAVPGKKILFKKKSCFIPDFFGWGF